MAMKGVMMAERPSAQPSSYGSAGAGGADSGAGASSAIGNYKGVMLCNRPTGAGGGTGAGGAGGTVGPSGNFRAGLRSERVDPSGHDPAAEGRRAISRALVRQNRSKEPSVFQKHKMWLKEFAEQRKSLIAEKERLEAESASKKSRFKSKKTALRTSSKANADGEPGTGADPDAPATESGAEAATRSEPAARVKPAKSSKPAWALSATEKAEADAAETEDLLAFAEELDLDEFLGDVEVRAALDAVRKRIATLDAEHRHRERTHGKAAKRAGADWEYEWVDEEEEDDARSEAPADGEDGAAGWEYIDPEDAEDIPDTVLAGGRDLHDSAAAGEGSGSGEGGRRRRLRRRKRKEIGVSRGDGLAELRTPRGGGGRRAGDDAESVAESVMTTSTTARLVHSKKSMTAVVEREKRRLKEMEALPEAREEAGFDDEATVDLHIVRHDGAEEAQKQKERHLATNLPYKNRNPYV